MKFEQAHMVFQKSPAYQKLKLFSYVEMIEPSGNNQFKIHCRWKNLSTLVKQMRSPRKFRSLKIKDNPM